MNITRPAHKMNLHSLISIDELTKEKIAELLHTALRFKQEPPGPLLKDKIMAACFYEPSTRTRLSFESAMLRLGGQVLGFSESANTSSAKGESLSDTMRVVSNYADLIVLRHPLEGAARAAADAASVPVINAGDGANQHPTQTLLDLFSILETQGTLDGLHIALAGDLKHARTAHSLALACAYYDVRLYLITSDSLALPDQILGDLRRKGIKFSFHQKLEGVIDKLDILYMTRIQRERFTSSSQVEPYILKAEMLENAKANLKILHPLPRIEEIEQSVDATPHAYYFEQARNGLFVRQAILATILD